MLTTCVRAAAWAPVLVLVAVAGFLAQVVQPWPEGRILLTLGRRGSHGVTVSDLVALGVVVVLSFAWLRWRAVGEGRVDPGG